jgi:hypothetical protein
LTLTDRIHRLSLVLDAEESLYVELRDCLQRERECMVSLDPDGLEEAVEAKEALAEEARLLEESRADVSRELADALGITDARPTLSRLLETLGDRATARLREQHSRLVALLAAVGELVDANASFARDGLAQVQDSLRMLGRLLPQEPIYRPAARPQASTSAGRLVRSVA